MVEAGAVLGPIERSSTTKQTPGGSVAPVHDLNVPYEGTEYETPTADMLFPPVSFDDGVCCEIGSILGLANLSHLTRIRKLFRLIVSLYASEAYLLTEYLLV